VLPDSSGCFTLAITAAGRFSGRVCLGGRRHGFSGRLDRAGGAGVSAKRGGLSPLTLTLRVDLENGSDEVVGSVTDGGWTSALTGDRNVFQRKLNPAPQAGARAFVLQQADNDALTAAAGFGAIARSGKARVKGRLEDGRAFSAGSLLARNGDCPFYLSFKRGTEVLIGRLNFPAAPTPTASGTVLWVRTGTNAFAATLQATSAP
jgi:hypothetical protein